MLRPVCVHARASDSETSAIVALPPDPYATIYIYARFYGTCQLPHNVKCTRAVTVGMCPRVCVCFFFWFVY